MPVVVTGSAYSGEVLEHLLVRATTSNELVEQGHINLVPNVIKKYTLPRIKTGRVLQKRKEQPQTSDSKGNVTYDERSLEPQEFMAYTEFNPRAFESIWRPFQPKGPLVFAELNPTVQNVLLAELAKVVDFELGENFVVGVHGSGETQFFNGILTRMKTDPDVVRIPNPTTITEANIINILTDIAAKVPKAIRKNPDLKIFMSYEDFTLYDNVITKSFKGKGWDETNNAKFKGIQIASLATMPVGNIFCTIGNTSINSNLWAGVSFVDDAEAVLIGKVTNSGELYFFKMLMKADTQIAFGEDAVLYSVDAPAIVVDEPVAP